MNQNSLVAKCDYIYNWNAEVVFEAQEIIEERHGSIVKASKAILYGIDEKVYLGSRIVFRDAIEEALSESRDGVGIVVSRPASLADELRVVVSQAEK